MAPAQSLKLPGVKSHTIHFMRSLRWFAGALSGAVALACLAQAAPKKGKEEVKKTAFGKTSAGLPVELYTLSNVNGMTVGIRPASTGVKRSAFRVNRCCRMSPSPAPARLK